MTATQFADVLNTIGARFNNAEVVVDRNQTGLGVLVEMEDRIGYPNLYVSAEFLEIGLPNRKFGWEMSNRVEIEVLTLLQGDLVEGVLQIRDLDLVNEMMFFRYDPDARYGHASVEGVYNERVTCAAIADYVLREYTAERDALRSGSFDFSRVSVES